MNNGLMCTGQLRIPCCAYKKLNTCAGRKQSCYRSKLAVCLLVSGRSCCVCPCPSFPSSSCLRHVRGGTYVGLESRNTMVIFEFCLLEFSKSLKRGKREQNLLYTVNLRRLETLPRPSARLPAHAAPPCILATPRCAGRLPLCP